MTGTCCCSNSGGGRRRRRVEIGYKLVVVVQILTTSLRQIFDFLGPLWTLILANFLTIVFAIFGFYGVSVRRGGYLLAHSTFSLLTLILNTTVLLLYTDPALSDHKSRIISLNTGALSWFETRGPGCVPDWRADDWKGCLLHPALVEGGQALVQIVLSLLVILTSSLLLCCPDPEKEAAPVPVQKPMTVRRVKRRSARSIQSSAYGSRYRSPVNRLIDSETSYEEGVGGRRSLHPSAAPQLHHLHRYGNSLHSRQHSTGSQQRRKYNARRTLQQQQLPRPPSARSSYSNYHPARVGLLNQAFEQEMATSPPFTSPTGAGAAHFTSPTGVAGALFTNHHNTAYEPDYTNPTNYRPYPLAHSPALSDSFPQHAMGQVPQSAATSTHQSETVI